MPVLEILQNFLNGNHFVSLLFVFNLNIIVFKDSLHTQQYKQQQIMMLIQQ